MQGKCVEPIAGFQWRFSVVPVCPVCDGDLETSGSQSGDESADRTDFTCLQCGYVARRNVPQQAMQQAILELIAYNSQGIADSCC